MRAVWLAIGLTCIVLGVGVSGGWNHPQEYDESRFYTPAIDYAAKALPNLSIAEIPFPGSPLILILQAALVGRGLDSQSLRMLSSLFEVVLIWVLAFEFRRRFQHGGWTIFICIVLFPPLFHAAFSLKHHCAEALFCILACGLGLSEPESLGRDWVASGMLALAVLTTQLAVPLCLALLVIKVSSPEPAPIGRRVLVATAYALPLVVFGILVWIWRGVEPPGFRAAFRELPAASRFAIHPGQLLIGFLMLGAWFLPLIRVSKVSWRRVLILTLPMATAFYVERLFDPRAPFLSQDVGIVGTTVRVVTFHNFIFSSIVAGILAAGGIVFLMSGLESARQERFFRLFVVIYLAIMLAVPFFFESYYLLLIVPGLFILRDLLGRESSFGLVRARQIAVAIAGFAYTLFKVGILNADLGR